MQLDVLGSMFLDNDKRLDFWSEPSKVGAAVDIRVSPEQKLWLTQRAKEASLAYEVIIDDVQVLIDSEKRAAPGQRLDWTSYHRLADILAWVDEMAAQFPDVVSTQSLGSSTLGNDVRLMKIARNPSGAAGTIDVFLNSNIHAREWITSATTTWMFNELLTNPAYDGELDKFNFHYVPVLNPDGFEYTWTDDRLWRKTLSDHDSFWGCLGVDPNRNWATGFAGPGTSNDKCSDLYHGPSAFSEPETKAASDYIAANKDVIKAYLDIHSYSQLVLLPWGYTTSKPDDYNDLLRLGNVFADALDNQFNTQYEVGTVPDLLYMASGGSFDWVKDAAGVKYSIGAELRDTGRYGFVLPADQIIPSGQETLEGLLAFLNAVRDETLRSKKLHL
jgi:murein tripeptide amidase MpaA